MMDATGQRARAMNRTKAKTGEVKPVYAVFGPEEFLKRRYVAQIMRQILGPRISPLALAEYDGGSAELAAVLDDLRTPPFLSERRLVVVREADAFLARELSREALMRYLDSPSPSGVLLLIGKTLDARLKLAKRLAAVGEVCKCEKQRGFQTTAWVCERAAERGKRMDPAAARSLVELAGDDLASLDNEVEKLSLYVGEGETIARQQVLELVGLQREETVFGITDAIADGDAGRALRIWEQTWTMDRSAAVRAIGGLAWGLRRLIEAKESVFGGESAETIARRLWTDPQRLRDRLDRWSLEALRGQLDALLEADIAIKTGLSTAPRAVEKFIVSQCHRQKGRKVGHVS